MIMSKGNMKKKAASMLGLLLFIFVNFTLLVFFKKN